MLDEVVARVVAAANRAARQNGFDVEQSLITVNQRVADGNVLWRVNYGPQDYICRRGGDLVIDVDGRDARVIQVLRGQ